MLSSNSSELIQTSQSKGWNGIVVEQRSHTVNEYSYPMFQSHLLSMHTGASIRLDQCHGGRTHQSIVHKGNISFVPAGQPSQWRHAQPANFVTLELDPKFVARIANHTNAIDASQIEFKNLYDSEDSKIQMLGQLLVAELETEVSISSLYAESLATALTIHLLRNYATQPLKLQKVGSHTSQRRLQLVVEYIHDNLGQDIRLANLAEVAALSPNYFITRFRQFTGLSPHQYVIKQRVEQAKRLLRRGHMSATEVAVAVGFFDQSHLTRHMRRLDSITPSQLLRQNRKNVPNRS